MKKILSLITLVFTMSIVVPAYAKSGTSGVVATSGVTASGVHAALELKAASEVGAASGVGAFTAAPSWVVSLSIIAFLLIAALGIGLTLFALAQSDLTNTSNADKEGKWQLAQALSEEVEITIDDKNSKKTIFVASSSRLIAFVTLTVLIAILLGVAPIIIWSYAQSGTMPGLEKLSTFFAACATPFLPYMANQARAALGNKSSS